MAGIVTLTSHDPPKGEQRIGKIVVDWTSDGSGDADGTDIPFNGVLRRIETDPDGVAVPTTLYDIALNTEEGLDLASGVLADRSATVNEQEAPVIGTYFQPAYAGLLTPVISNAGNAKQGQLTIFYSRN